MNVSKQPNSYKSNVAFGIKVQPELEKELASHSKKWFSFDSKQRLKNLLSNTDDTLTLSYNKEAYGTFTERIDVQSNRFSGVKTSLANVLGFRSTLLSDILRNFSPEELIKLAEYRLGQLASKQ